MSVENVVQNNTQQDVDAAQNTPTNNPSATDVENFDATASDTYAAITAGEAHVQQLVNDGVITE